MKKSTILGAVCALFMAQAAMAQTAEGVTYVEDPNQGYVLNKFKDNWFITGEGGVNVEFYEHDAKQSFGKRIAPAASLYVGKWFSPIVAIRLGGNWTQIKNLTEYGYYGQKDLPLIDGLSQNKFNEFGAIGDVLVNLTNWWCGYRPGRVYNAIVYAGGGGFWSYCKKYDDNNKSIGWKSMGDKILNVHAGIINQFNITKHFALSLDVRFMAFDSHIRTPYAGSNMTSTNLQAYLAATYFFNKTDWNRAMVPVCPEVPVENCDPVRQQLADANARISELEHQLDACLKRPAGKTVTVKQEGPLATVYFPINVSALTEQDETVLGAVAEVMKENPAQKYTVTGWADNYTGTDEINTRLRHERANSAAQYLQSLGVPADQLNVTINAGNLNDLGEKFVALDRAVTIEKSK